MFFKHAAPSFAVSLALVLLTSVAARESTAKTASNFRWLDSKGDHRIWSEIEQAFVGELTPDDPGVVGPQAAMGHKYIYRVGLEDSSALVLLALERDSTAQTQVRFEAYNYDIRTDQKAAIRSPSSTDFWNLRVVQLARFERTPVPDIVVQFSDCVACEAQKLLASFRYDIGEKEWRRRNWEMGTSPHTGWTLLVGSDTERGFAPEEDNNQADYLYQTACVYRIADLNGDGLDDVAVWCREKATSVESPGRVHSVSHTTLLFTAKSGAPKLMQINDPASLSALHRQICSIHPQTAPCSSTEGGRPPGKAR